MADSTPSCQPRASVAQDTSARGLPRKVLGAALGAVSAVPWSGSSTKLLGLATLFTSAIVCGSSASAVSIDTTTSWDGANSIGYWSPSVTRSYGQVITPDANGSLTDFTFYITPNTSDPIFYQARVYQWDSAGGPGVWGPTGSSIYNSGTLSFSGTSGTFSPVTINTGIGGVSLSAGTSYVLFFSTVGETQTASNFADWRSDWGWLGNPSNAYSGGDFVFSNNPSSFTAPWDSHITGTDLAFKANIADAPSNVPGPLPILGLAAAFGFSRKLRKRIKLHKSASAVSTTTGS